MGNIVKYTGFDLDALDKNDKAADAIAGSVFLNLTPGDHIVRFLPALPGAESPFRITALHYIDAVPGLDKMVVFACPRIELKEPCVACAEVQRLGTTKNPLDRERAGRIAANLKVYANVLDRGNPDAGPRVLGFGKMIWEQLKAIRKNARLGGDFTNPGEDGFDVIISRTGSGPRDTRYVVNADRNSSPLAKDAKEMQAIIEGQHNLEEFVVCAPPEELLLAWGQMARVGRGAAPEAAERPGARVMSGRNAVLDAKGTSVADPFDDEA